MDKIWVKIRIELRGNLDEKDIDGPLLEQSTKTTKNPDQTQNFQSNHNVRQNQVRYSISRSAHRTPNFMNPEYFVCLLFEYFFQIKVLN